MPLRHDLPPMRDFQLAKRFAWDPQAIDFIQDARDWAALDPREQDLLNRLFSMFVAGEEAVASGLAPLLWALGRLGNLREEEMFVTSQILDESLHVEFFHRWFEVTGPVDHSRYWGPAYRRIFFKELPQALEALLTDQSPRTFIRALVVYHLTVEASWPKRDTLARSWLVSVRAYCPDCGKASSTSSATRAVTWLMGSTPCSACSLPIPLCGLTPTTP